MRFDTVAIDADFLVYWIGYACQRTLDFDDGWTTSMGDQQQAAQRLEIEVEKYRDHFPGAHIIFCLSDTEANFRKDILPTYKGNRGPSSAARPVLFEYIRGWFSDNGHTECWANLEADDILGILATRDGAAMVTVDKDLLCVPGYTIHPQTFQQIHTTAPEADLFHLTQTLIGDAVDGYKGCPGIGKAKAPRVLEEGTWAEVVGAYEKAGLTEEDALVQARVAHILRDGEYEDGEVTLWVP